MSFTYEVENNNKLSFLDVSIYREGHQFSTSLYRKPTFSGLYTNFHSFISENYKKGLIYCLLFRVFTLSVDWQKFHKEILFLKQIFQKNLVPEYFVDKCVKVFLDKKIRQEPKQNVERQELKISLPFLGKYSNELKKRISNLATRCLINTKVIIIWSSNRKLRNFFSFKDRLPMHLRSKILYRYSCNGCNSIYLGKNKRHFLVTAYEHLGISVRTGKEFTYNPKNNNNTSILDHLHQPKRCHGNLDNFEIIGRADNDFFLRIKESLLIKKFNPTLNQKGKSIPLYLFD